MLVNRTKGRKALSPEQRRRQNLGPVVDVVREQDRQHVPLRAGPMSRVRYRQLQMKRKLIEAKKAKAKPAIDRSFMQAAMREIEQNRLPDLD